MENRRDFLFVGGVMAAATMLPVSELVRESMDDLGWLADSPMLTALHKRSNDYPEAKTDAEWPFVEEVYLSGRGRVLRPRAIGEWEFWGSFDGLRDWFPGALMYARNSYSETNELMELARQTRAEFKRWWDSGDVSHNFVPRFSFSSQDDEPPKQRVYLDGKGRRLCRILWLSDQRKPVRDELREAMEVRKLWEFGYFKPWSDVDMSTSAALEDKHFVRDASGKIVSSPTFAELDIPLYTVPCVVTK